MPTMITRKPVTAFAASIFRSTSTQPQSSSVIYICAPCQRRFLHKHVQAGRVPEPTPFVPDVATFLTLIGRQLSKQASKFTSWNQLFTSTSPELKALGIEPARTRKYLLRWREKFRNGDYGIGGDFKYVQGGVGEVRVVELPRLPESPSEEGSESDMQTASATRTPGTVKLMVNVPNGSTTYKLDQGQTTADLKKAQFFRLLDGNTISGTRVELIKGTNGSGAILKVQEGLWEDKRGHKVFGGERRRAETLHKLRVAERKQNER